MSAKDIVREETILNFLEVTEAQLEALRSIGLPYIVVNENNRLYNIESVATWLMTREYFGLGNTVYFPVDWSSVYNGYKVRQIAGTSNENFTFIIPSDFNNLVSLKLLGIVSAGASGSGKSISLTSYYAGEGEDYTEHTETDTDTYELASAGNMIGTLDLSVVFNDLSAGDICNVNVDHNAKPLTTDRLYLKRINAHEIYLFADLALQAPCTSYLQPEFHNHNYLLTLHELI